MGGYLSRARDVFSILGGTGNISSPAPTMANMIGPHSYPQYIFLDWSNICTLLHDRLDRVHFRLIYQLQLVYSPEPPNHLW